MALVSVWNSPGVPKFYSMMYAGVLLVLLYGLSADADLGNDVQKHKREAKGVYDYGGNGDLSKVEVDMTVEDYGEPQKLKCHNCYLSVAGNACMTMDDYSKIDSQECLADELWCMTESFYTDNELTTFTRKCSRDCEQGCQVVGDNYKLETCAFCCKGDFCNENVAGANISTASPLLFVFLSLLTLLKQMHFA